MSPREKHVPDDALRTSVCLTAEDRAAVRWISEVRRAKRDKRTTVNDVLVDALWYFLEKVEGRTRGDIKEMVPPPPLAPPVQAKVTEMPRQKRQPTK